MGKVTELREVAVSKLVPYGKNAKIHGTEQVQKIAESINAVGFLSPLLIDKDFNVIAGHGRLEACKLLGIEKVPCVFIEGLSEEERKAYTLADNRLTELGDWDMDLVFGELADLGAIREITGWDFPEEDDWFTTRERFDRTRQEGNDEYNDFLDKFEQPKTTDDCYTPDNIYEAIADYVAKEYSVKKEDFIRPFYPGGDYQRENYKGKVVVDNPPFSILSEIVDFYTENKIGFFLFAPGVSTLGYVKREKVCALCAYVQITYENGAAVTTSFLTNLGDGDIVAMTDPDLYKTIERINKENEQALHKELPKYNYPHCVITSARMGYLSKYGEKLVIKRSDSIFIRELDAQKETGKGIYGGALLLSERAAAERAAAERAAAERAAAETFELSEREKEIQQGLGRDE